MKKSRNGALALLLTAAAGLIGCGGAGTETAGTESTEDYVYAAEYQNLDVEGYGASQGAFDKSGMLYYIGSSEGDSRLFSLKIGEGEPEEIPLNLEEKDRLSGIGTDSGGNILAVLVTYQKPVKDLPPEEAGSLIDQVKLRKLSADGTVVEEVDVTNPLARQPEFYIQNVMTDKDGNYYISMNESVFVFDKSGRLLCEITAGTYISSMFSLADGRIIVGIYDNTGWKLKEVDPAQKGLKDLEASAALDYGTYQGGLDTDLLYTSGSILYACNLEDKEPAVILDWVDSDIDSNNLRNVMMLEDGRIAAFSVSYTEDNVSGELAVLTKKNRSEVPQKTILTYGTFYLPYFANQDIVAFNKQSDKYRIEVKTYGDDNTDFETRRSLLNADIAAGKGPDIIDLFYNQDAFDDYASTGVLEDLTPFLEKDAELKKEDFLPNILEEYTRDGKLYSIIPCFGLETIVGKVSDLGDKKTWTVQDMIALADSRPKSAELVEYGTRDSILNTLCTMNRDLFVDPETGACNFTGEEFKEILEFAARFPKEMNYDPNGPSEYDKIKDGQLVLMDISLTSVELFQLYEAMFGEPVNFIGYPISPAAADRTGSNGVMIVANGTTVGMNAGSANKEGVWEFIRFNLTEKRQENLQSANGGFPIRKAALEKELNKALEEEYYEGTNGEQKKKSKGIWGNGDFTVDIYAATPEQVSHVRELIESARGGVRMDGEMVNIIYEEAQTFFDGQKSAEDAASLIQDRVQNYVNESR